MDYRPAAVEPVVVDYTVGQFLPQPTQRRMFSPIFHQHRSQSLPRIATAIYDDGKRFNTTTGTNTDHNINTVSTVVAGTSASLTKSQQSPPMKVSQCNICHPKT